MEIQSYKIEEGKLSEKWGIIEELLSRHWDESAKNKQMMKLSPDYPRYKMLEEAGSLLSLFAYVNGNCVGYSINVINYHLHYSELLCSYNDVIFIDESYRNSPLGIRLIKETENKCREKGAKLMLWHAKENTTLSKLLPRMACKVQEVIFSKEL